MKDETYSSAQYNEKPSNWQNPPTASPSDVSDPKVIKLSLVPSDGFKDIRDDIIEFTTLALKHETFSFERKSVKAMLQTMCAKRLWKACLQQKTGDLWKIFPITKK